MIDYAPAFVGGGPIDNVAKCCSHCTILLECLAAVWTDDGVCLVITKDPQIAGTGSDVLMFPNNRTSGTRIELSIFTI